MPSKIVETKFRVRLRHGGTAIWSHISDKKPLKSELPKIRAELSAMAESMVAAAKASGLERDAIRETVKTLRKDDLDDLVASRNRKRIRQI